VIAPMKKASRIPDPIPLEGTSFEQHPDVKSADSVDIIALTEDDIENDDNEGDSESLSFGGQALHFSDLKIPEESAEKKEKPPMKKSFPKFRPRTPLSNEENRARSSSPYVPKRGMKSKKSPMTSKRVRRTASLPTIDVEPRSSIQEDVFQFLPSQSVFGNAFKHLLDSQPELQTSI